MKNQVYSMLLLSLGVAFGESAPSNISAPSTKTKQVINSSIDPKSRLDEEWWKERWNEKNKEIKTPLAKDAKLVFIGDSITQAWEAEGKPFWDQYFAPLGALNWGYSGDRTEHLIWRLQNSDLQSVSPKAAIMLIGTNNTGHDNRPATETVSGIKRSIEELTSKWPNAQIVIVSIFPRGETTEDACYQINLEINQQLQVLADNKRVHLLDLNPTFLAGETKINKDLFPDFLHLSPAAYKIWAEALSEKLTQIGVK